MNKIKKFEYYGNEITFNLGEDIMINATEMAKPFGKKPAKWLELPSTRSFLSALVTIRKSDSDDFQAVKTINGGTNPGTWMNQNVAIEFSRWLSPHFGIWCNDRILELLKYGYTFANEQTRDTIFTMAEAAKKIKEFNSDLNIGKNKTYREMRRLEILDANNKPYQEWIDKGYFEMKPYHNNPYLLKPVITETGIFFLIKNLFPAYQSNNNENSNVQFQQFIKDLQDEFMLIKGGLNETIGNLNKMITNMQNENSAIKNEMSELKLSIMKRTGREESLFSEVLNKLHHLVEMEHSKINND